MTDPLLMVLYFIQWWRKYSDSRSTKTFSYTSPALKTLLRVKVKKYHQENVLTESKVLDAEIVSGSVDSIPNYIYTFIILLLLLVHQCCSNFLLQLVEE